jgi:endonuclease/exonuclease/phosphatase family metal-dependent hydrolase
MSITTLIVSTLLAASSPHHRFGLTEAMPRLDGTIRVASYNMLNYFDQSNDPALEGEYDDFGTNPGPTTDERCRELADAIRAVDADVIALEEVESLEAITFFNDTYLADMGYKYVASKDVGYYRGCEQSLLSRFPITETAIWTNADLTKVNRQGGGWDEVPSGQDEVVFQRSPLFATVQTDDGYELSLFALHHKAGRNRWHREAEALKIMEYVAELQRSDPDRNIIILGDFNAQPWDRSMQVYRDGGMVDSMTLRTDLSHGYASPLRQTHTSGRVIDFILLNHAAIGELVPGSGFVKGTSAQEYDWRNDPIPAGYASDHYPIAIDIVPREGAGSTVTAAPWPRDATRAALAAAPAKRSAPKKSATPPKKKDSPVAPVGDGGFVASKRSKVFHTASCGNAKRISEKNLASFDSIADAEDAGKKPAKCCKPGG